MRRCSNCKRSRFLKLGVSSSLTETSYYRALGYKWKPKPEGRETTYRGLGDEHCSLSCNSLFFLSNKDRQHIKRATNMMMYES